MMIELNGLRVYDKDNVGDVEFEMDDDYFNSAIRVYLTQDQVKQLIDHLNQQIS